MLSCSNLQWKIAKTLIKYGTNIDIKDNFGNTAFDHLDSVCYITPNSPNYSQIIEDIKTTHTILNNASLIKLDYLPIVELQLDELPLEDLPIDDRPDSPSHTPSISESINIRQQEMDKYLKL